VRNSRCRPNSQPFSAWRQQPIPLPTANLLFGQQPQNLAQQGAGMPFGMAGGQWGGTSLGAGPFGQLSSQPADALGRSIPPFLAQQNLAGQAYGMAASRNSV
jgi:hypothetical protein